jgi:HK97 family phage portal protein
MDVLLQRRETAPAARPMVGFADTGGLVGSGVTATTTIGLSSVWRCLDILSNGVSQLPWYERRGTLDLPPSRIVNRPQAHRTRREWTSLVVSTLALHDVCYLLKVGGDDAEGVAMGLWPLDPSQVQPTTYGHPFLPPTHYYVGMTVVPADRIVILRRSPQPGIEDTLGGILRLARITFASAIAAESYSSRYWQGGGSSSIALETDATIDQDAAQKMSDAWAVKRARGPDYVPVLGGGLKAKNLGLDPTSASAVEARRELVADVARYFGVPTRIVNAPTGDSETYSSTEAANQDLVRYTLQNYIGAIEDAITDQLPGGRHLFIDPAKLTRGTFLARAQAFQLATGGKAWMLPEDVRDDEGLPPVEDPDKLNPPPPTPVAVAGGSDNGREQASNNAGS